MIQVRRVDDRSGESEKEEEKMKIILTVGHSILKTGSCTSADGRPFGGVLEYTYNKNIVYQTAGYLRSAGHQTDVLICPELQFVKSTEEREYKLSRVNNDSYDLVCELHLNASKLHHARGCEVLYKSEKGKQTAQQILNRLTRVFGNRGVQKRDNLYMLNSVKPTAVMLETFFCDNSADCALAERADVALLIAEGIHGGDIISVQDRPSKEPVSSGMLYRVQTGAFTVRENAENLVKELRKKDIDAFITIADLGQMFYRVQVGAFSVKENAVVMQQILREAGYDSVIIRG